MVVVTAQGRSVASKKAGKALEGAGRAVEAAEMVLMVVRQASDSEANVRPPRQQRGCSWGQRMKLALG